MKKIEKIMNKKGDHKFISPWFFINLFLVGTAVIIGAWTFYSLETDIKYLEAKVMEERIIDAISSGGFFNQKVLDKNFNLMKEAGLDEDEFYRGGDFYFKLIILNQQKNEIRLFEKGEIDIEKQCQLTGKDFGTCRVREIILLNKNNFEERYYVQIIAGSKQKGQRL